MRNKSGDSPTEVPVDELPIQTAAFDNRPAPVESATTGQGKGTPRVEIVDPLRGLAALAVAWFHFTNGSGFVKTEWLQASGEYGWLGVDVFFVISGFVIPHSMYCGGYQPN